MYYNIVKYSNKSIQIFFKYHLNPIRILNTFENVPLFQIKPLFSNTNIIEFR